MNNFKEIPDCLALKKAGPKPCNQSTTEERYNSYKEQAKFYHPDIIKNKKCIEIAESKFKQLANCCDSSNDYKPNKNYNL